MQSKADKVDGARVQGKGQRSYLGRPVVLPSVDGKPGCEAGLRRQESAEAIVSGPSPREGLNVE